MIDLQNPGSPVRLVTELLRFLVRQVPVDEQLRLRFASSWPLLWKIPQRKIGCRRMPTTAQLRRDPVKLRRKPYANDQFLDRIANVRSDLFTAVVGVAGA